MFVYQMLLEIQLNLMHLSIITANYVMLSVADETYNVMSGLVISDSKLI